MCFLLMCARVKVIDNICPSCIMMQMQGARTWGMSPYVLYGAVVNNYFTVHDIVPLSIITEVLYLFIW